MMQLSIMTLSSNVSNSCLYAARIFKQHVSCYEAYVTLNVSADDDGDDAARPRRASGRSARGSAAAAAPVTGMWQACAVFAMCQMSMQSFSPESPLGSPFCVCICLCSLCPTQPGQPSMVAVAAAYSQLQTNLYCMQCELSKTCLPLHLL